MKPNSTQGQNQGQIVLDSVVELFENAKKLAEQKNISISEAIDLKVSAYEKYAKNANEATAWYLRGENAKKMIV